MTRREFFKRTAPLVAAGAVTPSFVTMIAHKLFGPKKYWDFGAARQKTDVCQGMDVSVKGDIHVTMYAIATVKSGDVKWSVEWGRDDLKDGGSNG